MGRREGQMHGLPRVRVEIGSFAMCDVAEMVLPRIRRDRVEGTQAINYLFCLWRKGIGLDFSGLGKHSVCLEKYGEENDTERQGT
jgi:hypothetical protein